MREHIAGIVLTWDPRPQMRRHARDATGGIFADVSASPSAFGAGRGYSDKRQADLIT